jgi:hypothetical protein
VNPPRSADPATLRGARPLAALVTGHIAIGVATIAAAVPLLREGLDAAAHADGATEVALAGPPLLMLAVGLAGLVLGQVLSVRRVLGHRRAVLAGHPGVEDAALAVEMRRIGWAVALPQHASLLGMYSIAVRPPPAPLLALLCVLPVASLLLDHAHAGLAYQRTKGRGPRPRLLPSGDGERVREKLRRAPTAFVGCAVVPVLLALLCAARLGPQDTDRLSALLATLAAASTALLFLLLIRPLRRLRGAVYRDEVNLPVLDTAAHALHRLGALGAIGAALVAAAVLTARVDPLLGALPVVLLVPALGALTLHLASTTCIGLGAPFPNGGRPASSVPSSSPRPP